MAGHDFDLFVIGGGSGGVRAARIASGHGAKVALAESHRLGGTCVIRGCVPKKLLVYAAHFSEDFEDAPGFGWQVGRADFSWPALIANKDREIHRLEGIYGRLLDKAGVRAFDTRARLTGPNTVALDSGETVTATTILIATGGWPFLPEIPGIEHVITSNEALHLDEQPRRIVVVGGGYIAVEFAGIFNGLGSQVTQLYRGPQILRGFDDDVRATLAQEIRKKGIDLWVESDVASIEKSGDELQLTLTDGTSLETDAVLYATGRVPNSRNLGLEELGVEFDQAGGIVVDAFSKTSVDNIYAVGDVTNRIALTPVAIAEGHAFADTLYGGMPRKADHENVPSAVFSQPSVATVGLTEAEALERHGAVDVYKSSFRPMRHTLSGREETTFMKLIVAAENDLVVGAHMVGPDAAEIIQGVAIAVKCGAKKADFDATIGIHPTAAEEFVTMREKFVEPVQNAAE